MTAKKVLVLLGTKAQFVKMAPVLLAMDERSLAYTLVYTGQHSETFKEMEAAFGTRAPDIQLFPDFEADTHFGLLRWTCRFWLTVLKPRLFRLWAEHEVFLVHGDTASTLFGAILGRVCRSEVAHIEAGLRSPKLLDPFPEEVIRRLVSRLSTIHFCPDEWACSNLQNVTGDIINTAGNTLFDSLRLALDTQGVRQSRLREVDEPPFGIVSIHRNENLSRADRFESLMSTMLKVADQIPIKFVLHPATKKRLRRSGWLERLSAHPDIQLLDRMDYFQFIALMSRAKFLMTDGGSNQEESAQLGIPCLLLRKSTERRDGVGENVELSNLDWNRIVEFAVENRTSQWTVGVSLGPGAAPSKIIADSLAALNV